MTETNQIYSKNKHKKRKDTVLGTKKWHITTETAGIIKIKESYENFMLIIWKRQFPGVWQG